MPRVREIAEGAAGLTTRMAYRYAKKRLGAIPTPMAVIANHPWVFRGYGAYEFTTERSKLVEPKLKALASIKTATLVGCPF